MGGTAAPRILVVDDAPEILALIESRLKRRGFDVQTAADGEQALAAALGRPPDLVVLDIMMPKRSGWEVARALRRDPTVAVRRYLMTARRGERMSQID